MEHRVKDGFDLVDQFLLVGSTGRRNGGAEGDVYADDGAQNDECDGEHQHVSSGRVVSPR